MISEVAFCHDYSSFWRVAAPTTDLFVRRLNTGLYERDFRPMVTSTAPERRGFVNEVAFALFCGSVRARTAWPSSAPTVIEIQEASASVRASLAHAGGRDESYRQDPTTDEATDICEQHKRMMITFTVGVPIAQIVLAPAFSGCGIIDGCAGDVLVSSTLYEVKAGERFFRSIDIRQLLTYAALNYISRQYEISAVGLFNPRLGIRTVIGLDDLCFEVSGKDAVAMLAEIALAISSGEISR